MLQPFDRGSHAGAAASRDAVQDGRIILGFSAGLGADMMLLQSVFLRGEYEYTQITSVQNLHFYLNNFRAGLGVKF